MLLLFPAVSTSREGQLHASADDDAGRPTAATSPSSIADDMHIWIKIVDA